VDHAAAVRFVERAAGLDEDLVDPADVEPPLLHLGSEGAALDVLHDDEERLVVELAEVVELDGVRVRELDDRLGLAVEARDELGVLGELGVQGLDRDLADRGAHLLLGQVHPAHAALAEQAGRAVASHQHLADERIGLVLLDDLEHRATAQAELGVILVVVLTALADPGHEASKGTPRREAAAGVRPASVPRGLDEGEREGFRRD